MGIQVQRNSTQNSVLYDELDDAFLVKKDTELTDLNARNLVAEDGLTIENPADEFRATEGDYLYEEVRFDEELEETGIRHRINGLIELNDGRYISGVERIFSENFAIFDPETRTVEFVAHNQPDPEDGISHDLFSDAIKTNDGKVVFIPKLSANFIIFDPSAAEGDQITEVAHEYQTQVSNGQRAFERGVLLPDGRVIALPNSGDHVAVIDTDLASGSGLYTKISHGQNNGFREILAAEDDVFVVVGPFTYSDANSNTVSVLDFRSESDSLYEFDFGTGPFAAFDDSSPFDDLRVFVGAHVTVNNNVVLVPNSHTEIPVLDIDSNSFSMVDRGEFDISSEFSYITTSPSNFGFGGSIKLDDGKILMLPSGHYLFGVYDPGNLADPYSTIEILPSEGPTTTLQEVLANKTGFLTGMPAILNNGDLLFSYLSDTGRPTGIIAVELSGSSSVLEADISLIGNVTSFIDSPRILTFGGFGVAENNRTFDTKNGAVFDMTNSSEVSSLAIIEKKDAGYERTVLEIEGAEGRTINKSTIFSGERLYSATNSNGDIVAVNLKPDNSSDYNYAIIESKSLRGDQRWYNAAESIELDDGTIIFLPQFFEDMTGQYAGSVQRYAVFVKPSKGRFLVQNIGAEGRVGGVPTTDLIDFVFGYDQDLESFLVEDGNLKLADLKANKFITKDTFEIQSFKKELGNYDGIVSESSVLFGSMLTDYSDYSTMELSDGRVVIIGSHLSDIVLLDPKDLTYEKVAHGETVPNTNDPKFADAFLLNNDVVVILPAESDNILLFDPNGSLDDPNNSPFEKISKKRLRLNDLSFSEGGLGKRDSGNYLIEVNNKVIIGKKSGSLYMTIDKDVPEGDSARYSISDRSPIQYQKGIDNNSYRPPIAVDDDRFLESFAGDDNYFTLFDSSLGVKDENRRQIFELSVATGAIADAIQTENNKLVIVSENSDYVIFDPSNDSITEIPNSVTGEYGRLSEIKNNLVIAIPRYGFGSTTPADAIGLLDTSSESLSTVSHGETTDSYGALYLDEFMLDNDKLVLTPGSAENIAVIDVITESITKVPHNETKGTSADGYFQDSVLSSNGAIILIPLFDDSPEDIGSISIGVFYPNDSNSYVSIPYYEPNQRPAERAETLALYPNSAIKVKDNKYLFRLYNNYPGSKNVVSILDVSLSDSNPDFYKRVVDDDYYDNLGGFASSDEYQIIALSEIFNNNSDEVFLPFGNKTLLYNSSDDSVVTVIDNKDEATPKIPRGFSEDFYLVDEGKKAVIPDRTAGRFVTLESDPQLSGERSFDFITKYGSQGINFQYSTQLSNDTILTLSISSNASTDEKLVASLIYNFNTGFLFRNAKTGELETIPWEQLGSYFSLQDLGFNVGAESVVAGGQDGDVQINRQGSIDAPDPGEGIVLTSNDGTRYEVSVENGGTVNVTEIS